MVAGGAAEQFSRWLMQKANSWQRKAASVVAVVVKINFKTGKVGAEN